MMFLTKKVYNWQEAQYDGEGVDAPEKVMITLEKAMDNVPLAIFKFAISIPMLYLIVMMYDAAIAHHLQYDLSMVIVLLELVYLIPSKSLFLKIVDIPMLIFNTIICHPIASYGYLVTVPLDLIRLAFQRAQNGVSAARQNYQSSQYSQNQTSSERKIIDADVIKEHH